MLDKHLLGVVLVEPVLLWERKSLSPSCSPWHSPVQRLLTSNTSVSLGCCAYPQKDLSGMINFWSADPILWSYNDMYGQGDQLQDGHLGFFSPVF